MSTPFLGEIKIVSFNFPPKGWALCNGQFLPINQNQALFSLFGTMYGGNGQTTFALPDLRGRVPVHIGSSLSVQGQRGGEASHTVIQSEMPQHIHIAQGYSQNGDQIVPTGNVVSQLVGLYQGGNAGSLVALSATSISNVGGSQPHENRMPYLVLNFIVALQGIFPSRN
ncbi:MAG TPA: tail fiber protein [Pyrinomonadaceae bacterium]|nr:tail fiber protein [Pyrinomonadaceae bacterium]